MATHQARSLTRLLTPYPPVYILIFFLPWWTLSKYVYQVLRQLCCLHMVAWLNMARSGPLDCAIGPKAGKQSSIACLLYTSGRYDVYVACGISYKFGSHHTGSVGAAIMGQRVAGHPAISPFTMAWAKTITACKREASKAKEASLQCALAAYQEALASNEVLSVCEAAWHFDVPKSSLQDCINGWRSKLESNAERHPGLMTLRARSLWMSWSTQLCRASQIWSTTSVEGSIQSSRTSLLTLHSMWVRSGLIDGWRSGESGSPHAVFVNLTEYSSCKGNEPWGHWGLLSEGSGDHLEIQDQAWLPADNGWVQLYFWPCMQAQGDWADRELGSALSMGWWQRECNCSAPHLCCWCMHATLCHL